MNYVKLTLLVLLGWIGFVTFRKMSGRNTINSQVVETENEQLAHQSEDSLATAGRNGATPAMATLGILPLAGVILNPFLSGGNIRPAQVLPAYGIEPWLGTSAVPETNQPLRN